jgi:hypothetical protein
MIFTGNQILGWLIRENEMGGTCGKYREEENPEGKILLGRVKRR